jgi:hypothetical protein
MASAWRKETTLTPTLSRERRERERETTTHWVRPSVIERDLCKLPPFERERDTTTH